MGGKFDTRGFTLIEALAAIAIIAIVIAVSIPFVGSYVNKARLTADRQTLAVLNDALSRYKTQGGSLTALTSGASIGNILTRLQTPLDWNGLSHQVLRAGETYSARSLTATGSGRSYRFISYGYYTAEDATNEGSGSETSNSNGVGHIEVSDYRGIYMNCESSTGFWALKIGSDEPIIYPSGSWAEGVGGGSPASFWACAGNTDSTLAGNIISINCNGYDYVNGNVISLDILNCTALEYLNCSSNQLTSLDLSGLTSLRNLDCSSNQLTSLDLSGLTSLLNLNCSSNQLSSLSLAGIISLNDLNCSSNQLTSLNLSGLTSLLTLNCSLNQLTSLNLLDSTKLLEINCNNNLLTSLDLLGLSDLKNLSCYANQLTSLNVSELTSLEYLHCYDNLLISLNASNLLALQVIECNDNQLISLDTSNLPELAILFCHGNQLPTLNLSSSIALLRLSAQNNQLVSITWPNAPNLSYARVGGNNGLVGSTAAINTLYSSLPNLVGGAINRLFLGTGAPAATDTTAIGKGWNVFRAN